MSIREDRILVPSQILCTVHPRRTTQILVAILPRLALANANAGDLDGDTFFVCWDEGLVPPGTVAPADYSGTAEQVFGSISPKDMVHHFAFSDQASRRSSIQVLISYLCAINILMEEDARQNQFHQGIHIAALSYFIQFHHGIIADQACDSLSLSLCVPVNADDARATQQSIHAVGRCQRRKLRRVPADQRSVFAGHRLCKDRRGAQNPRAPEELSGELRAARWVPHCIHA